MITESGGLAVESNGVTNNTLWPVFKKNRRKISQIQRAQEKKLTEGLRNGKVANNQQDPFFVALNDPLEATKSRLESFHFNLCFMELKQESVSTKNNLEWKPFSFSHVANINVKLDVCSLMAHHDAQVSSFAVMYRLYSLEGVQSIRLWWKRTNICTTGTSPGRWTWNFLLC